MDRPFLFLKKLTKPLRFHDEPKSVIWHVRQQDDNKSIHLTHFDGNNGMRFSTK